LTIVIGTILLIVPIYLWHVAAVFFILGFGTIIWKQFQKADKAKEVKIRDTQDAEKISEADRPRKVRKKDLTAGMVVVVIGLFFLIPAIGIYIYAMLQPYTSLQMIGLFSYYLFPVAIVFLIIGFLYIVWKSDRIKKGKI
jgi:Ca2+/Na+ antiporter